jgi:hypothetical protein
MLAQLRGMIVALLSVSCAKRGWLLGGDEGPCVEGV